MAGRVGEALAYLTMTKMWGYVYWDRIASVWMRAAHKATIQHKEMVRIAKMVGNLNGQSFSLQPDFVFETSDNRVALMEAKGSFVTPGNIRPNAKGPLKHGLDQTAIWAPLIKPTASKCIAINSLLREESDSCGDPSVILHVDPPPERNSDIEPVEIHPESIRRGNYGAWLMGMGFRRSGFALAYHREFRNYHVELPVVTIQGQEFALSIQGLRLDANWFGHLPMLPFDFWPLQRKYSSSFLREVGVTGVYALGLEVRTLRTVCASLVNPDSESIMDLPAINIDMWNDGRTTSGFYGSIFPDGSLMGIVSRGILERELKYEKFTL